MTLELLLTELADPACYPHAPRAVELIQTHLSVVCLAGDRAYKLKKPVTLPFVDFSTLSARRQACRDEVRLNRRLCPDVYLGTAALRRIDGQLRLAELHDDEGAADIDVAVVMRRLPQDRMLDELVAAGAVGDGDIRDLARRVAAFHAGADRGQQVRAAGSPERLARFAAANFTELQAVADHRLPASLLDALAHATAQAFDEALPELQRRAAAGRVVDGHGDLHARNVCMIEPPAIYDCIEFEPAFRCGDVATEIAFLAMDLRYRGAPALAKAFVDEYVDASGDDRIRELLPLLCCYRAMVRAKVATLAAAEPELSVEDRAGARSSAHRHVRLAAAYAIEHLRPVWVVLSGPPASGKSRLAGRLAAALHWTHLATDAVRKELAGIAPTETAGSEHYTAEASRRTYAELLARAAAAAEVVVLDGNFPTRSRRDEARAAARAAGCDVALAYLTIDRELATRRARSRSDAADDVSDAGPGIAAALHARFEPPDPDEAAIVLDGSRDTDELVDQLLAALLARGAAN